MGRVRRVMIHVVGPVAAGAAIYLLFRTPHLLVFSWTRAAGLAGMLASARHSLSPVAAAMPEWMLYSAPDGLWVYALTAAMLAVWRGDRSPGRYPWIAAGVVLGAGGELGQLAGFVPGTFDIADLLFSVAAFAAALYLVRKPLPAAHR
jgi:hypothetical protein